MKNGYYTILLIALLVLMVPVASMAIDFPHDLAGNNYGCGVCHKSHQTLGTTGYNNLCTACHNPNDPKAGGKPFYQADAASPFATVQSRYSGGILPGKIYQSSHNWTGSDVNPSVGSSAPTSMSVSNPNIQGTILCVRCHNVHGTRESANNTKPFLRGLNDNDQMCKDCHKIRSTTSHMTGSHPVNVNYSSMTKIHVGGFQSDPINANPANPTSAMKLVNGSVQCTTCHAVHYSDSRSGTVDGAAAYNQLSTSKGHLLRTDARGKTATDLNICTNCHAGKAAHNGTGQNVQCNDCHSGHVEYDPYATTTEEKKPNIYVLRRFMIVSTAAGRNTNVRTFYRYTGARKEFYRGPAPADGALGVCQACHYDKDTFKSGHYVDPNDPTKGIKDERINCASCHNHKGTFGCSDCHGFPPKINQRGADGYAVWSTATNQASRVYPLDESRTPHSSHADAKLYKFECLQCHKGNVNHNTGNFQQVFLDKNGIIAGGSATYNTGSRTCSNMYCHSDAKASPAYRTVSWENTRDTIVKGANRCQSCHADKLTTAGLSDAHERHAATGLVNYSCQNCHASTLRNMGAFANNTALVYPSTTHVNGSKDVSYSFDNTGLSGKVTTPYNSTDKTCDTIYCHSNGAGVKSKVAPKWNDPATGQCGSCHGVLGPVGTNTFGMIGSNAHFAHLSSTYGPRFVGSPNACQKCHSSFVDEKSHVDGNKVADQSAGSTCYKCHGGTQQGPLPTWSDNSRIACTKCHPIWTGYSASRYGTVQAPKQINYTSSGHGKSAAPYNKMACIECHDRNSNHISNPAQLGDNKRLIFRSYTATRRGGANAVCGACHWEGQSAANKVRFTHVTSAGEARNGTPTMACSRCHNVHGTSNFGMINDKITFKAGSSATIVYQSAYSSVGSVRVQKNGPFNFIQTTAPYRGICQVCHTNTIHFKRGVNEAVDGPATGSNPNFGGSFASHRNFGVDTNCLSCHPHNPPPDSPATFAFYPYGQCNACHGYPPVPKSFKVAQNNYSSGKFEDYTGGGGAHIVAGHIPASANPSQGWALCTSCHKESDHLSVPDYPQVKVSINNDLRFNSTIQPKYSSNRLGGAAHKTGTCYNVSCHFQRTPAWGTPSMP